MRSLRRLAALALALVALASCGKGAWIQAKAGVAQLLLVHAWQRTLAGDEAARPWPWADTSPVARLRADDADRIVLAGASGAVLAFGPGHLHGTAAPGAPGNAVLAGHRDTHFAFLRHLVPGDALELETVDGVRHRYRVAWARVLDEGDVAVLDPTSRKALTLVTCYPFDTPIPGGPLRWVVRAYAVAETSPPSSAAFYAANGFPLPDPRLVNVPYHRAPVVIDVTGLRAPLLDHVPGVPSRRSERGQSAYRSSRPRFFASHASAR